MDELPKSALSYYVQLYCKKRHINNHENNKINVLAEATRSWSNLSVSKKKIFFMKYNNCHLKLRKRFAEKLRHAIPFQDLPEQENQQEDSIVNSLNRSTLVQDVCHDDSPIDIFPNGNSIDQNSFHQHAEIHPASDTTKDTQEIITNLNNDQETVLEPIPPAFRTTRELYYIIKKNIEDVVPWESLSRAQKAPYMATACRIKRFYLMEYTNYLESLSNENLLAHYKRKVKDV